MRLTIVGFKRLIPKILALLGAGVIFYGFFSIILVNIYQDYFSYCTDVNLNTSIMIINDNNSEQNIKIDSMQDCLLWGGDWIDYRINASNFLSGLLYLFLISAT